MMLLPKQQKLIEIIIDNYGQKGKKKTLGEMIIEAGYSENTAINPKLIITEEMQEKLNPIVSKMEEVRLRALNKITDDKLEKSTAKDNASIVDIMTKNSQLLSGGSTDKITINLSDEQKEKLKSLFK